MVDIGLADGPTQYKWANKAFVRWKAVGGAEIDAMVGGMIGLSERDVPILVDGFIVTTASMIACQTVRWTQR